MTGEGGLPVGKQQQRESSGEEMHEVLKPRGLYPETSTHLCLTHILLHPTLPELFHFLSENFVLV